MSIRPASWHRRQLEHVAEVYAENDKHHTEEELRAARTFLNYPPPFDELIPHEQEELFQ